MLDVGAAIEAFFRQIEAGSIEIYNEFSLQPELGLFLRTSSASGSYKVQFERPVAFFALSRSAFVKKEIDLSVFTPDKAERVAIEVKFPRNGQHPEQMFKFWQDIAFVEQLVAAGFNAGFFVAVVDDPLFYSGVPMGIYSYFRGSVPIHGTITKPTGKRDASVGISGSYTIDWHSAGSFRYACIRVSRPR